MAWFWDVQNHIMTPNTERAAFGRSFSLVVMTSVLVVFVATVALLAGFVLWTSGQVDKDALGRQGTRTAYFLNGQLDGTALEQQSITIWDDAITALRTGDMGWIDLNFGIWLFDYFHHDESYILVDGDAVYASVERRRQNNETFASRAAVVEPLADQVRALARNGYVTPPFASDFVVLEGIPAIIAVSPIVSDTGNIMQPPGTEPLLVTVIRLDLDYELRLIEKFQLEAGRFTMTPGAEGFSALPVTNRAGRIVTFYEWEPYRPGETLLQRTGPALIAAFAVLGIAVVLLFAVLWRSSTALANKSAEAERQATEDALTGLPNRLSFERQFARRLLGGGGEVALLMLDLDRFKHVNDTLGHHAGDELIRLVAGRLQSVIGPSDGLARLGGDEFAVLHTCRGGPEEVAALAQRIIEVISRPFRIHANEAFVGVSIGIVIAKPGHHDARELSRRADIALYEAKSGGRNRAAIYQEAMDELVQSRHTIEAELREALRVPGQLWVAFQPLFDKSRCTITGAEALLRWTHPKMGPIPPARFIAVAESTGLIEALGEFVLRRATVFGARWPGRTIAVNISPAQLRNPNFADRVFAIVAESGMSMQDLEFEITEGILLDDEDTASDAIARFRYAGIRIALDDFGTGYSSLNYLKRYPVDRIKIDRSFVSQLSSTASTNAIVQAMVTLAHALGIEVTAEGVETVEQFNVLAEMGCNTFQGYLMAQPMTTGDIEARLSATAATARVPQVA
jgi:diguanylate cyclase (GGDEF)-like protein